MHTKVHRKMTREMVKLLPSDIKDFFYAKINGHKVIEIIMAGSYIEDSTAGPLADVGECVVPWLEHFWQQNLKQEGLNYPKVNAVNTVGCLNLLDNRAAYLRATDYWEQYVVSTKEWSKKNAIEKEEALLALGRMIHLLQDMGTPAHTNNDMHVTIPSSKYFPDWWDDDDFEDYVGSQCSNEIPHKYRISSDLHYFDPTGLSIHALFYRMARETIKYDSDDVDGKGSGLPYRCPYWTIEEDEDGNNFFRDGFGDLTDWACDAIAKNLMPLNYAYSATLLLKFLIDLKIYTLPTIYSDAEPIKLKIALTSVRIKRDQDNAITLKVVNGSEDIHINASNLSKLESIQNYHHSLKERIITTNEGLKVYIEAHNSDTIKDLVARAEFEVEYNQIKGHINKTQPLKLTYNDREIKVELEIKATQKTTPQNSVKKYPPLKFYRVHIDSLDKESGSSWFSPLGNDDIEIEHFSRTTTDAILSSHETMKLIEKDILSGDDDVNDFTWEQWKQWIHQPNHIEHVHIAGSSSSERHRIRVNIREYTRPSRPSYIEAHNFKIMGYLHSVEKPLGEGKYNTHITKKRRFSLAHISVNSNISLTLIEHGISIRLFISKNEWHSWIAEGKGLHTIIKNGVKYNFITFVQAIKRRFTVSSYMQKIHVLNDHDWAWGDWGEIYEEYYKNGKMITKFGIKTIDGGSRKTLNKRLAQNEVYQEGDAINFDIKVKEYDSVKSNESLGTVHVNIPYREWSRWSDKANHITGYIRSTNGDARLSFRFQIREIEEPQSKALSPISNDSITASIEPAIAINNGLVFHIPNIPHIPIPTTVETKLSKALKRLPKYDSIKENLKKPLVDERELKADSNNTFYYNNSSSRDIVLHRKWCSKLKQKDAEALYLTKKDIYTLKRVKNYSELYPDYALRKLKDELPILTKKLSRDYTNILITRGLIRDTSKVDIIRNDFENMLHEHSKITPSIKIEEYTNYHKIVGNLRDNYQHSTLLKKHLIYGGIRELMLKNKIKSLKKEVENMSRKEKITLYRFKRKLQNATFCSCCRS
jgi:hypothetical protein